VETRQVCIFNPSHCELPHSTREDARAAVC
jgi:hypothetical protein